MFHLKISNFNWLIAKMGGRAMGLFVEISVFNANLPVFLIFFQWLLGKLLFLRRLT